MLTIDSLAQEIRRVDGNHSLGAGALAEALMPFLSAFSDKQAVEVKIKPLEWKDVDGDIVGLVALARTSFDTYFIERDPEGYVLKLGSIGLLPHQTFEAAKAAAQTDYEQRSRSALVDVSAVEPVAIGYVSSVDLHLLKQSAAVVDLFSKPEPGPIEFIPVYTSPPLSHRGGDSAEVERALAFVARWAWREDPPNANSKLTDAERLSVIKHHPTVKSVYETSARALLSKESADAGGSAITTKGKVIS